MLQCIAELGVGSGPSHKRGTAPANESSQATPDLGTTFLASTFPSASLYNIKTCERRYNPWFSTPNSSSNSSAPCIMDVPDS